MSESEPNPFDYVDQLSIEPPTPCRNTLQHTLAEHDDRPDELGVYPREVENGSFKQWIVAEEGSFVDLADVR